MHNERLPILTFEGLAIDQTAFEVYVYGETVPIARAEFEILVALAKRYKIVLSKNDLANISNTSVGSVTEHIRRLRKIVGRDRISNVLGVGYRWESKPVGTPPKA